MVDFILQQILAKARHARNGGVGALSTGERLAVALVLNRHDWLSQMDYTMAEAIGRLGDDWVSRIPQAAKILFDEGSGIETAADGENRGY